MEFFRPFLASVIRHLFPPVCIICGCTDPHGGIHDGICGSCYSHLPHNLHFCHRCALPLPETGNESSSRLCGRCIKKPPAFDYCLSAFRYEAPVVSVVHQLKFGQCISYAPPLARSLLDYYRCHADRTGPVDAIVPVPLHASRLRQRGFNQSSELARVLAGAMAVPVLHDQVHRRLKTSAQAQLNLKQRNRNIRGAFTVAGDIQYDHVLIIDDVVTTGSTVAELASVLKKAGVTTVGVLSLARAPL